MWRCWWCWSESKVRWVVKVLMAVGCKLTSVRWIPTKIIYDSNFGYIFTTDCTDYTDFSSQEATMPDAEQSEWQEPPRLKNPYNPCNPLWKNPSEPLARRSQFFMNLIICGFRRIHVNLKNLPNLPIDRLRSSYIYN